MSILLRGSTWNHSRGYSPLVSAAQRFSELHPEVEIVWEKRSLQEFADYPIEKLAELYDLLVIDHPWAGYAHASGILVPLESCVSSEFLSDLRTHSVGQSFDSYCFNERQVALPIDAAAPVASYRPDLLRKHNLNPPTTWDAVIELATSGRVIIPSIPVDTVMNFYMFCVTMGASMFDSRDGRVVVSSDIGIQALEYMRQLTSLCTEEIFSWNPIRVYEVMTSTDEYFYCPFAYGYSNYARIGYARHTLSFQELVTLSEYGPLISTLGGTGLAVSSLSQRVPEAVQFVKFVASSTVQKTLFYFSGGQPGHKSAWVDIDVNRTSENYFSNTLSTLERAYVRPRYSGYLRFQEEAGSIIVEYLQQGGNEQLVLSRLDALFQQSLKEA